MLGAAAASGVHAQASLDETLQWMADFYHSHGGGVGVGAIWVDMTLDRVSRCDIQVRSNLVPLDRALHGLDSFYLARLSSLSPRVVLVRGPTSMRSGCAGAARLRSERDGNTGAGR
jgi:hypothetical protein